MVARPGSGGKHRVSIGPGSGLLAAGVVLLAASAAAPVPPPADQPGAGGMAGADPRAVQHRWSEPRVFYRADQAPVPPAPATVEAGTTTDLDDSGAVIPAVFTGDIPATVLDAYRRARDAINVAQPGCHLPLELLAAIGKVETGHARGGRVDGHGTTVRPILGPALDGRGFAAIPDTDGGTLDGDTTWDRAVGPMQFIPGTWRRWAADGNRDNRADPHNVYDASLAAARYLCAANRDLGTPQGLDEAILSYNHSTSYRNLVLRWMATYAGGAVAVPDATDLTVPVLDVPPSTTLTPPTGTTPPPTSTTPTPPSTTPTPPSTTPTPPSTTPTPPSTTPTIPPPSTDPAPPPTQPSPPPVTDPAPPPSEPPPTTTPSNPVGDLVCGVGDLVGGLLGPVLQPCSPSEG